MKSVDTDDDAPDKFQLLYLLATVILPPIVNMRVRYTDVHNMSYTCNAMTCTMTPQDCLLRYITHYYKG
jgi:hypothetical protein